MINHIQFAHNLWKNWLQAGDKVIDATCGNGKDSFLIASLIESNTNKGTLFCFDIAKEALERTKERLKTFSSSLNLHLFLESHCQLEKKITDSNVQRPIDLICYNLGYLPGSDKTKTTLVSSTLESLEQALQLIAKKGAICITCYPGHEEGKKEQEEILRWGKSLCSQTWWVSFHYKLNQPIAPTIVWIQPR